MEAYLITLYGFVVGEQSSVLPEIQDFRRTGNTKSLVTKPHRPPQKMYRALGALLG